MKEEIRKVEVTHDEDDAQILASSHVPLPQGTELPSDRLIGRSKRLLQVLKVVFGADVEFADGQVGHEPLAEDEARSECEYLVAGVFVAKEREFIEEPLLKRPTRASTVDVSHGIRRVRNAVRSTELPMRLVLSDGHRKIGARFNRFGIITTWVDGNSQTIYFDDLTYTCKQE